MVHEVLIYWKDKKTQNLNHKINAVDRCSSPAGTAHNTTHKHWEQQQVQFIITCSLCCASYFSMLHIVIFSHLSKHSFSTLRIVDIVQSMNDSS